MKKILILILFLGLVSIGAAKDRRISDNDGHVLDIGVGGGMISSTGASIVSGSNRLDTPGTAEAIGGSNSVHSVILKADSNNSDVLYIGPASVTSSGYQLHTGVVVEIRTDNVADIFFDGEVTGDRVEFIGIVQ